MISGAIFDLDGTIAARDEILSFFITSEEDLRAAMRTVTLPSMVSEA